MDKKQLLFVDDEPNILQGLRRMLRPLRNEWDIETAQSGEAALTLLERHTFDVIVSDMRMPGMDGAQLLTHVMQRFPHVVRIVLSGQSDQESIFRSVGPAHQYLAKPCDAETLKTTIDRALSLRDMLTSDNLRKLTSKLQSLPSLPTLYNDVLKELHSPEPSIEKIGKIISKDISMTAKLLQLVNSAFFGFYKNITDPTRAIMILGLDKIKSLVLSIHIFSSLNQRDCSRFNLDALWRHNLQTGHCAKEIAKLLSREKNFQEETYMAGLLHDIGKLILMANLPDDFENALKNVQDGGHEFIQSEYAIFGATHAEVGAYLLGLWGLPGAIIESVAFHHQPLLSNSALVSPLVCVHAADIFVRRQEPLVYENADQINMDYLAQLGLTQQLSTWEKKCSELPKEDDAL
ncbi:HDOD domain-containing protein [bacterium]|nr:HDOD domain-containing protein [bacterium]